MKKAGISKYLLLLLIPLFTWAASNRTVFTEIISTKKTNQDITITPTGTGDVVLKAYSGFLKWASGVPTEQASISLTSDVSGTLPVANGGTNSSTALNNNFVMISSGGAIVEDSAVSTTELSYLDGVTSAIQTQLNGKLTAVTTTQGDLIVGDVSGNESRYAIGAANYLLRSTGTTIDWLDPTTQLVTLSATQTISGTKTFSADILMSGTGQLDLPAGSTAQRSGSPTSGMIRFNSDTTQFEGYNGTIWDSLGGSATPSFTTVTKNSTGSLATSGEDIVLADASGGDITLTLPAASGNSGLIYRISKSTAGGIVTIDGNTTETIGGELTTILAEKDDSIQIACNGTSWFYISDDRSYFASYESNAGNSISSATLTIIDFEDVIRDNYSLVTTGASWKYTAPIDGIYNVNSGISMSTASGSFNILQMAVNTTIETLGPLQTALSGILTGSLSTSIYLAKDDYIQIKTYHSDASALNLSTDATRVWVSIYRTK